MSTHFHITSASSLRRLIELPRKTRVTLTLPQLSPGEAERYQESINRLLEETGGEPCTFALIACIVACILYDEAHWAVCFAHAGQMLAANLAVCVALAAAGKFIGLAYARWRLARIMWAIDAHLHDDTFNPRPSSPDPADESSLRRFRARFSASRFSGSRRISA